MVMTDSLHKFLLDTGIQFLTWIHTLDAQRCFHTATTEDQTVTNVLQPKWKQEPDTVKTEVKMQCKLKYASKNKSFKTIMHQGNENAIRASRAAGTWDLLTPPPTGALTSSQALWERRKRWNELIRLRVTPHKHYKLTL